MKIEKTKRIALVIDLGERLYAMSKSDRTLLLVEYGVELPPDPDGFGNYGWEDYRSDLKINIAKVSDEVLKQIQAFFDPHADQSDLYVITENKNNWSDGYFRLFISYKTEKNKEVLDGLSAELLKYGITCFVAHSKLKTADLWQEKIEAGVRTCDAFLAYIPNGYLESAWCNQEIGMGYALNKQIILVFDEVHPDGFITKYQGINLAHFSNVQMLAQEVFESLVEKNGKSDALAESLANALLQSNHYRVSSGIVGALKKFTVLSEKTIEIVKNAYNQNNQVSQVTGMRGKIEELIRMHQKK